MQTITYALPNLLKLIRGDKFQIPQFQRPFRWRIGQVKLLVDSLIRGYPVGSLLVMGRNDDLPLKARGIDATIAADDSDVPTLESEDNVDDKECYLILDGQQRITSIARVFLNADSKNSYYFDLYEMLHVFGEVSEVEEESLWIKTHAKGKQDPERKKANRWLRADVVLDPKKSSIFVAEYIEDSGDFSAFNVKERREKAAIIGELFEVIRKYQIPVVVIDSELGIESVCRVFETINSTGTRLTTFDLAVAKFFPKPDLRDLMSNSRDKYPIFKEFEVDGDRILQVVALSDGYKNGRTPEPSRSGLLAISASIAEASWESAAKALQIAYQWVKSQGAREESLPNSGIVVAIAGMLFLKPNMLNDISLNFSSTLRRWYFSRVLREGATGGAATRMTVDFLDLMQHVDKNQELTYRSVLLTIDNIVKLTSVQDNRYKAIQCIIAIFAKEDLLTQETLTDDTSIEHHHIFPRSYAKTYQWGAKVNSVANLIAISKKTNRDVSNKQPTEYLGNLRVQAFQHGTVSDLKRRLETSLLPFSDEIGDNNWQDHFVLSKFDNFIIARATIIHRKISSFIGASLVSEDRNDQNLDDERFEANTR